MVDEPLEVRRKIGLERRYNRRQDAADAFTLRQDLSFRHHQNKAEKFRRG